MKKGESTKIRIISEAYKLFIAKGYRDVSMQDICLATGLSKGGLYRHFSNMENIFLELLKSIQLEQKNKIEQMIFDNLPSSLILKTYFEDFSKEVLHPNVAMTRALIEFFLQSQSNQVHTFLNNQYQRGHDRWSSFIRYGTARNEMVVTNIEAAVTTILFAAEGLRICSSTMPITSIQLTQFEIQVHSILGMQNER